MERGWRILEKICWGDGKTGFDRYEKREMRKDGKGQRSGRVGTQWVTNGREKNEPGRNGKRTEKNASIFR